MLLVVYPLIMTGQWYLLLFVYSFELFLLENKREFNLILGILLIE